MHRFGIPGRKISGAVQRVYAISGQFPKLWKKGRKVVSVGEGRLISGLTFGVQAYRDAERDRQALRGNSRCPSHSSSQEVGKFPSDGQVILFIKEFSLYLKTFCDRRTAVRDLHFLHIMFFIGS